MTRNSPMPRPRSLPAFHAWALAAFALLGLASCEGAAGAVCQLDSDCETGLLCCKGSASLTDRGVCAVSCLAVDAGPRDLGVSDAGPGDQGVGPEDAGDPSDLSMSVDLGEDAAAPDAGPIDLGASPDLGEDAGPPGDVDASTEPDAGDAGA